MADFDYAAWVARAQAFTERLAQLDDAEVYSSAVAPPVGETELGAVERALGPTLPSSLRALFTRGAAGLDCRYAFEPDGPALDRLRQLLPHEIRIYGGARLGPASELPDFSRYVGEWAEDTWVAEWPDQKAIWESALPFAALDNGDYLALDLRGDEADPPVVYLNHDDESSVIAGNFVAFLTAWERLCYVGPEHWMLLEFTAAGGHLDPDSDRAAGLRQLLAP
jgi:hypothetical protein